MGTFSLIALLIPLFSLLMVFRAFSLYFRRRQTWRELFFWLFLWLGIAVISFWPNLLDYFPDFFGIKSGINILIFFGFIVLFYGFFRLFTKVEDLERQIVDMNRKIALEGEVVRDSKKKAGGC